MTTIDVQEMEKDPLGCLQRVEAGETLIVMRDNQPVAEIKPPWHPIHLRLPYGVPPELTAPQDIAMIGPGHRWAQLLAAIAAHNVWIEVEHVSNYLDFHSDVAGVLPAICCSTREEFGLEAGLTLEINRDPEMDDKYLKLCVSLPEFGTGVSDRFRAIADAYDDQLWDKKGYILITTGRQLKR
jgi:hypothetical protein